MFLAQQSVLFCGYVSFFTGHGHINQRERVGEVKLTCCPSTFHEEFENLFLMKTKKAVKSKKLLKQIKELIFLENVKFCCF